MSLIQTISDFFESLFKRSSPEVQKKQLKKKMEAELRSFNPAIYRDGLLLPNFGEALFILYKNTKALDDLFLKTISPTDTAKQHRFEAQLIMTGYSSEFIEILDSLTFENKKNEVLSEVNSIDRVYIHQRKLLEKVLKELNTDEFKRMDKDLLELRHFADFCRYNFIQFLQIFDSNFIPADFSYKPRYSEVSVTKVVNLLEDFYYQLEGLKITTVTADQVRAIAMLLNGGNVSEEQMEAYIGALKKINYTISRILSPDKIKALIRMARSDMSYEPAVAKYTGSPRQEFASNFEKKFNSEEQRIKTEIQDEQILTEMATLFKGIDLENVLGYDNETNALLQEATTLSFKWVLPFKVLKTFLRYYISSGVKSLLNDLVIEGFFSNPLYKSNFSSTVFAVINADISIKEFEDSFAAGQPHNVAVIQGYIKDSHKDKDFYNKLVKIVDTVNKQAHDLMQNITTELSTLYKELGELLADAKKPSSEIISNVKVLMMSSRNRDNTNLIEEQYANWKVFFNIMKSYVIINNSEINHDGRE